MAVRNLSAAASVMRPDKAVRCINVVNFIRGVEPRGPVDLFLPVRKQMELVKRYGLPATWLLQYDSLCLGPFVEFLKREMPPTHEAGLWFEMNELHCKAAGVEWRGRPGYEWDWQPSVAFSIGYTVDERNRLIDEAVRKFRQRFGVGPRSVASWNLDSHTIQRFVSHGVDAFAVCRDQIATDGFTIWGGPIAGYYPSRTNAWSPAVTQRDQIHTPVLRMLGQDPVYYYDNVAVPYPDTMEPAWPTGRNRHFIDAFFKMLLDNPAGEFAYAQLGQENSFGWPDMAEGFAMQMELLGGLKNRAGCHIETMSETGRRFKGTFKVTPNQAQVQLEDPLQRDPAERSIWFQNRNYRANLHIRGDRPYLRDVFVYRDGFSQPFLDAATRDHQLDQRQLAVLDGFHWRADRPGTAGGFIDVAGAEIRLTGDPIVTQPGSDLSVKLPIQKDAVLVSFINDGLEIASAGKPVALNFRWESGKSAFIDVANNVARYRYAGFDYSVVVRRGSLTHSESGWRVEDATGRIALGLG